MENFQRFIKIGDDRINVDEIIRYGLGTDEDDDNFLYVETKTSEDIFEYYEGNVDFDLEEKLEELDKMFLLEIFGQADPFKRFIKFGDERINAEEIVRYGLGTDEDDDHYLFVETRTNEDVFEYYEYDMDFELDEKFSELDGIFLIRQLGRVDFRKS